MIRDQKIELAVLLHSENGCYILHRQTHLILCFVSLQSFNTDKFNQFLFILTQSSTSSLCQSSLKIFLCPLRAKGKKTFQTFLCFFWSVITQKINHHCFLSYGKCGTLLCLSPQFICLVWRILISSLNDLCHFGFVGKFFFLTFIDFNQTLNYGSLFSLFLMKSSSLDDVAMTDLCMALGSPQHYLRK